MNSINSIKEPYIVSVSGFSQADEFVHMFDWLGGGDSFIQTLVRDVEEAIYSQTPEAQIKGIACKTVPFAETKCVRGSLSSNEGIVSAFTLNFPLSILINLNKNSTWSLNAEISYSRKSSNNQNLENKVKIDFHVIDSYEILTN